MLSHSQSNTPHDCSSLVATVAEHGRRIGDNTNDIKALHNKYDSIMRVVTEAKESQDKACQVMAQTGLQLTSKLDTMSNAQHTMQLDFTKLSTSYAIDRENQTVKKGDNRWLIGIVFSLITAANILMTIFR